MKVKNRNQLLKIVVLTAFLMTCLLNNYQYASATTLPYMTYNYDYREDVVHTPAAYTPYASKGGDDYSYNGEPLGNFVTPQDLCRSQDGRMYLADTGNNRIVVLSPDLSTVDNVISGFENNGEPDKFNAPTGVCVSQNNQIYIADSLNRRVVVLELDGKLTKIIENPTSESLDAGYVFTPLKVTVDYADRVYCIAQNMFEGIMVFEKDGSFTGFFGTISVKISFSEKFWKRLASKEERSKQRLFIPTEFTGIDVDDQGFIYASSIDEDGKQAVRRLNPKGEDVIKKGTNENVGGDVWVNGFTKYAGASQITDVVYRGKGIYSLLDRKRGRIFTYDHEGNLLYIFGGLGSQEGTFVTPVAIEAIGDRIVALDSYRNEILIFEETKYGNLINDAVSLRYDGNESQAVDKWKEVLRLDANNELANTGIGKAYLSSGENKLAMKYLKIGMSKEYYSVAFRRYRNNVLKQNLDYVLSFGAIAIVAFVVYKKVRKKGKKKKEEGLLS